MYKTKETSTGFLEGTMRWGIHTLLLLVLVSCLGNDNQDDVEKSNYTLMTVETQDYVLETQYSAQIKGIQDIKIIPRVDGYLESIYVKEGDKVKKGQLLFVIDQVAYLAQVKEARASVLQAEAMEAKAQIEYDGKLQLHEKHVISDFDLIQTKRDLEVAQANLEAARSQLDAAQNNLSFTELRSPSDGVIGKIPYRKGDYVGPSQLEGLTVVSDNHQMYIYFSMTESQVMDYLSIYDSMQEAIDHLPEITLELPGGHTYEKKGHIESVSGIVDEATGSVSARSVFPNEEGRLLSGGTARIILPKEIKDALIIPQEATFEILDHIYAYRVIEGETVSTILEVEKLNDGLSYVVTKGLSPGDVIIAQGVSLLSEGTRIED